MKTCKIELGGHKMKLETYGKQDKPEVSKEPKEHKEGVLLKLWNKTIFPDMIKNKKEEKNMRRQIYQEARKEALQELGPEIKEQIKKQELDKMTGKNKKDFLGKLAKGFEGSGNNIDQKLKDAFSMGNTGSGNTNQGSSGPAPDVISRMMGSKQQQSQQLPQPKKRVKTKKSKHPKKKPVVYTTPTETPEEKIRRMLH